MPPPLFPAAQFSSPTASALSTNVSFSTHLLLFVGGILLACSRGLLRRVSDPMPSKSVLQWSILSEPILASARSHLGVAGRGNGNSNLLLLQSGRRSPINFVTGFPSSAVAASVAGDISAATRTAAKTSDTRDKHLGLGLPPPHLQPRGQARGRGAGGNRGGTGDASTSSPSSLLRCHLVALSLKLLHFSPMLPCQVLGPTGTRTLQGSSGTLLLQQFLRRMPQQLRVAAAARLKRGDVGLRVSDALQERQYLLPCLWPLPVHGLPDHLLCSGVRGLLGRQHGARGPWLERRKIRGQCPLDRQRRTPGAPAATVGGRGGADCGGGPRPGSSGGGAGPRRGRGNSSAPSSASAPAGPPVLCPQALPVLGPVALIGEGELRKVVRPHGARRRRGGQDRRHDLDLDLRPHRRRHHEGHGRRSRGLGGHTRGDGGGGGSGGGNGGGSGCCGSCREATLLRHRVRGLPTSTPLILIPRALHSAPRFLPLCGVHLDSNST
mmetsp:Transcript_47844/g.154176  ORF Transcript_47844/g.154176 Transcript_47844/m.154176 type:complete len:494 (+) Transcript_47844:118-1599(+)